MPDLVEQHFPKGDIPSYLYPRKPAFLAENVVDNEMDSGRLATPCRTVETETLICLIFLACLCGELESVWS